MCMYSVAIKIDRNVPRHIILREKALRIMSRDDNYRFILMIVGIYGNR